MRSPPTAALDVSADSAEASLSIATGAVVASSPPFPPDVERATLRKVTRRLVPFLFLLYLVCYLDRVNVGFAALQMNRDLGFSASVYGLGVGVFFLGYCLFEVPSNLVLARVGARRWIARIMISWGAIAAAMMFVRGPASFYALRFLLGVAEAGLFPGLIYYVGDWFPSRERARAIARFMTALPLSVVVGGPLSGACSASEAGSGSPAGSGCFCWREFRRSCWVSSYWLISRTDPRGRSGSHRRSARGSPHSSAGSETGATNDTASA